MIAARLANLQNGSNRFEKKVGQHSSLPTPSNQGAASALGVSERTVISARAVLQHGTEEEIASIALIC